MYRPRADILVFSSWLLIYRADGGLFKAVLAQRLFHWGNVYRLRLVWGRCLLRAVLSEWASRLVALELPVDLAWATLGFGESLVSSLLRVDLARPASALISGEGSCILVLLVGVWTWHRGHVVRELIGDHHQSRAIVAEETAVSGLSAHVLRARLWIPAVIVFLTTHLLLLLVHLHDLHDGLLHLDLFASLAEPIVAHLEGLVQFFARFESQLSVILVFLELILVEWWNVVMVSARNSRRFIELVQIDVGPVQEGIWMAVWSLLVAQTVLLVWAVLASSGRLLHSHLSIRIIQVLGLTRISLPILPFGLELFLGEFELVLGNFQMVGRAEKVLEVGTFLSVYLVVVETLGCRSNNLVKILWLLRFAIIFEGAIKDVILLKVVSLILVGECCLWHKIKGLHLVLLRDAAHEAVLELGDVLGVGLLGNVPIDSLVSGGVLHREVELRVCLLLLIECRRHELVYLVIRLLNLLPQDLFHLLLVLGGELLRRWGLVGSHLHLGLTDWGLGVGDLGDIWLHGEGNHTSSNLDRLSHLRLQLDLALRQYQSSELGKVILEIKSAVSIVVFDQSVASTNRYIGNSHITFMASSQFEDLLISVRHDQMDHPRTIFLKSQRLEEQEILIIRNVLFHIDESVRNAVWSEDVWVGLLADFALELFPGIGDQVFLLLLGHLLLEPVLQALVVDVPHWTITLAGIQERILSGRGVVPTDLALNIWTGFGVHNPAVNFDRLLLELVSERVEGLAGSQELFAWRILSAAFLFLVFVLAISLAAAGVISASVIFDIELDST